MKKRKVTRRPRPLRVDGTVVLSADGRFNEFAIIHQDYYHKHLNVKDCKRLRDWLDKHIEYVEGRG